jgi:tripartite-type tricarboxylate transporter receptor subunit TctC
MASLANSAIAFGVALMSVSSTTGARAQDSPDFYKGKTISLYVGSTTGGVYDVYARLLARHMGRHIPGSPKILPMNMEGAGGLRLANFLYNAAPKDGTVMGTINRGAPFEPLLGEADAAKFDASKFTWLGSASDEVSTCVVWKRAGVERFDQLFAKEITVGGTGGTADTNQFPKAISAVLGAKIKLVSGYPGGADIDLAMERGEVDGRCGWSWSSIVSTRKQWLDNHSIWVVVQLALHRHPDLPDVPLIMDYAKTPEQREMLRLIFVRGALGCPFLAPPGIPANRAEILRRAFDATMQDASFLAEAKKSNLEIAPVEGRELQRLIADIYRTPADVVAKTKAVLK